MEEEETKEIINTSKVNKEIVDLLFAWQSYSIDKHEKHTITQSNNLLIIIICWFYMKMFTIRSLHE